MYICMIYNIYIFNKAAQSKLSRDLPQELCSRVDYPEVLHFCEHESYFSDQARRLVSVLHPLSFMNLSTDAVLAEIHFIMA